MPSRICSDGLTRDRDRSSSESLSKIYPTPRHQALEIPSWGPDSTIGSSGRCRMYRWRSQQYHAGRHRAKGSGQEHLAAAHRWNHAFDEGRVTVKYRVSPLLELGAGFTPNSAAARTWSGT